MVASAKRRSGRLVLTVALLCLTSCGTRWTHAQEREVAARSKRAGTVAGPSSDAAGGADTVTGEASVGTGTVEGSGGATSSGGQTSAGTGPTTAGGRAASGPLPCAAPSTAVGVTPTEIRVGSISSLSGPVPGLAESAAAAVRSYVAYRNATGGICGRKIVLKEADDGTDNGRYRSEVAELNGQVFGIDSGFAVGDVGGVDVISQTKIPMVGLPSSVKVSDLPTVLDVNPSYANPDGVIGKYKYLYDRGARRVAVCYIAVEQSRDEANNQMRLMKAASLQVALVQEIPLSQLSYDSTARAVANSGADYLFFIGDDHSDASMARSMADSGYKTKFADYFSFAYQTSYIEEAGAAAEGTTTWLRYLPNDDAPKNKELATFLKWMDRVSPGAPQDAFAADAWVASKAFFDALTALPGPITRDAFVAKLTSIDVFDAGGMFGPIHLGPKKNPGCMVGMIVEGGHWKRLTPASGFLC
jgi:ABC-type branched-subunit amino acid transport system substrate-binding protein